jgi:peptidoglycan/xylan/chitin deacetylase (PgdA/CDA1 family)
MGALESRHDVKTTVVALTFDDGLSQWTHAILHLLAQHGGHATFFALGCLAAAPEGQETLKVIAAGSEIGNHTFSHPSLPTIDDDAIRDELGLRSVTSSELLAA